MTDPHEMFRAAEQARQDEIDARVAVAGSSERLAAQLDELADRIDAAVEAETQIFTATTFINNDTTGPFELFGMTRARRLDEAKRIRTLAQSLRDLTRG